MNTKTIQLVLIIFGLNSCLTHAEDDEAKLMRQNPDWHITSQVYTNPPYWLVPTNVPFRLGPLSNGKWVWTTNAPTGWYGPDGVNVRMDSTREREIQQQWRKQRQQRFYNAYPGIAHVSGYSCDWNGTPAWTTNMAKNWYGVWTEDTNTGWRINLRTFEKNLPNVSKTVTQVLVGSIVTNSGVGLLPSPDWKFTRLELLDATGKVVQTKKGAALSLYDIGYGIFSPGQATNYHLPPSWDATVTRNYPETISDMEYLRWNVDSSLRRKGMFTHPVGFMSNGPPCIINFIIFDDIFDIKAAGDYTLTVQPVLFRMHYEGGTFQGYLDRVDLPSVTTKVHLVPKAK